MTITAPESEVAIAPGPDVRPAIFARRSVVVVSTVAGVVAVNLLILLVGRALGGAFTYRQNGKLTRVDAAAVIFLSAVPLTIGLALIAWASRPWPVLLRVAKVVAPLLAVATIGAMTVPAGFDTTSTLALATMHLAFVPATVLAFGALGRRRRLRGGGRQPHGPGPRSVRD